MLGRILVELQQHVGVAGDLRDRLGVLRAVVELERLDRDLRLVDILGVVDVAERRQRTGVRRLGQGGKNVGADVEPAPLGQRRRYLRDSLHR
jgi:hypothetical protein